MSQQQEAPTDWVLGGALLTWRRQRSRGAERGIVTSTGQVFLRTQWLTTEPVATSRASHQFRTSRLGTVCR